MDVITTSLTNFTFIDRVPAASKPTSDGTNNGVKVEAGGDGTLKIEAAAGDKSIRITASTSTSATIELKNTSGTVANSRFGSGINKLTIQTSTNGNASVRVTTTEPVGVPDLPGISPATDLTIVCLGVNDTVRLGGSENAAVHAVIRTGAGGNEVYLEQDDDADATTTATVDFDPSLGGGLGSGNLLWIGTGLGGGVSGVNCIATLAKFPGSSPHTITVDNVILTNGVWVETPEHPTASPATLIIEDESRIGELTVDKDIVMTPTDLSELNIHPVASIEAPVTVEESGTTTGKIIADGRIDFLSASDPSTVFQFDITTSVSTSTAEVNVQSGADVTVQTSSKIGALSIAGTGVVTLQERAGSPSSSTARALSVKSVSMGTTPTGDLDLKDNAMIVDYTGSTPLSYIQSLLTSGFAAFAWTGNGINSSIAAAVWTGSDPHKTAVGYAEASDFSLTTFAGQSVDNTSVLLKYTLYGDANLDGRVNNNDFTILAANFGMTGRRWSQANFNYDAIVNANDFTLLAGNFNQAVPGDDDEGEGFAGGGGDPEYTEEELWKMLMDIIGGG